MRCEDGRERLSRLLDGELGAADQSGLFGHLEACGDCRAFLETLTRARGAIRRDREALRREADAVLPPWPPRPADSAAGSAPAPGHAAPSRRGLPAPALLALAAVLLVAGIAIGAGLAGRRDGARARQEAEAARPAPESPRVVYVCAMPEYQVVGEPVMDTGR